MKRLLAVLGAAVIAGVLSLPNPASAAPEGQLVAVTGEVVAGQYLAVLKSNVDPAGLANRHGATLRQSFGSVKVFSFSGSDAVARKVAGDKSVLMVQPNVVHRIQTTQTGATWGIDRIDQRALPLSGTYTYTNTGAGVKAYIIDTGIRFSHNDFGGRAVSGFDAIDGGSADDCHGHGTHVSGTVGGTTYGVAKGVSLIGVRVLDCNGSGTTEQVVNGINWVTGDHAAGAPAVANMSLGGSADTVLDNAVRASIADGVSYAIAAGNGLFGLFALDACTQSPARVAEAITVSATNNTDTKASWANRGTCVDIFAPGINITSSWNTSNTATNTINGTSMATPHVAGAAALYLQSNPGATPQQVRDALVANATTGVVKSPGSGSPNRLLFVNY